MMTFSWDRLKDYFFRESINLEISLGGNDAKSTFAERFDFDLILDWINAEYRRTGSGTKSTEGNLVGEHTSHL